MTQYCNKNKCIEVKKKKYVLEDSKKIPKKLKDLNPNITLSVKGKRPLINEPINSPEEAADILGKMTKKDREEINVVHLDSQNKPIGIERVSIGVLNSTMTSSREIFKGAILNNANSIIIAHNHPSGNPIPSEADRKMYCDLKKAGEIMQINVLDSIVMGNKKFNSLNEDEYEC